VENEHFSFSSILIDSKGLPRSLRYLLASSGVTDAYTLCKALYKHYTTISTELANRYLKENGFGAKMPTVNESEENLPNSLPFLSRIRRGPVD